MTHKDNRKTSDLRGVAPFIAVLIVMIALAALAQTRGADHPSGKSSAEHASPNISGALLAQERSMMPDISPQHAPLNRLQTGRFDSNPMDSNPPLLLPAVVYHAGGFDASLAVADVNGDGRPDLLVTDNGGSVNVLLGNGDGTFQAPVAYNSGGSPARWVAVADLNGDGKPDLAVANFSNTVGVLLGNGDGTFQPAVTYASSSSGATGPDFVALADVNSDGKPDIVVINLIGGNSLTKQASVLIGNGDGTFQPAVGYSTGGQIPVSVAVADVNGDGKPDLLIANEWASDQDTSLGSVGVLIGNGDGTFESPVALDSGGSLAHSVAVEDVNGDGKPDVVVSNCGPTGSQACVEYGNPPGIGVVSILLGNGDGTFRSGVTFSAGVTGASSIAVADISGDGKKDITVSSCGSSSCDNAVGVLLGNGDGTFQPALTFGSGGYGGALVGVADVNGDARPDVLVATCDTWSCSSGAVGVLLNNTGPHSPTTTTMVSSLNPAPPHKAVTYTATVTSQDGGAVSGSVIFQNGGLTIATVPLVSNQAAVSTVFLKGGSYSITAIYSGDLHNLGSTSGTLVEYVSSVSTKTVVTTSVSPSYVGQPVTFTATITPHKGTIPDGELVTFYDGTTAIGTGGTAGGVATFATSSLNVKTHSIKASYAGDTTFIPSSGTVQQVVNKFPTTTALTSSLNPSEFGQAVTFTAHVTSSGPVPTGKVKFLDGTLAIGSTILSGGVAKLTKSNLAVGTHPITAQYLGDGASDKSTSAVVTQVVQ
jgi:hypothetical protein